MPQLATPEAQSTARPRPAIDDAKPLTAIDVALHFSAGYNGLGAYLRAKQRHAERSAALVHHAIVPAAAEHRVPAITATSTAETCRYEHRGIDTIGIAHALAYLNTVSFGNGRPGITSAWRGPGLTRHPAAANAAANAARSAMNG